LEAYRGRIVIDPSIITIITGINIAPDLITTPRSITLKTIIKNLRHNLIAGFMNPSIHLGGISAINTFIKEVLKNLFTIKNILLTMTGIIHAILTPEVPFILEPQYMNRDFQCHLKLGEDNNQAIMFSLFTVLLRRYCPEYHDVPSQNL
jgi:hypothetical protein